MDQEIQEILRLNGIQEGALAQALHQDIRELFLEQICTYMKSGPQCYVEIRRSYYRASDDILAVKNIVRRVCGGTLPDEDLRWLDRCIRASFHKKDRRRQIPAAERESLWRAQDGLCALCRRPVALGDLHVDHIIPWDYVGDELEDNLQVLCPGCNWAKNSRLSQTLHNLFLTRKGAFHEKSISSAGPAV